MPQQESTNFVTDPVSLEAACSNSGASGGSPFPHYEDIAQAIDEIDGLDVFDIYSSNAGLVSSFEEIKIARTGTEYVRDGYVIRDYASVLVCRIAPIAAFTAGHTCWERIGEYGGFSNVPDSDALVAEHPWDPNHRIPQILHDHGFSILDPQIGRETMPNGLEATTLLGDGDFYNGWTVFDGWFHCID
ncbi:MAG: hypothetical protein E7Z96_05350 [Actinomycetaceae bacterium]|nr:hypothetical protein [Actinomycetaceae bacterium]